MYIDAEQAAEALGKRGDPRGVQWLVAQMGRNEFAQSAAQALMRIVQASAERLSSEDLRTILDLQEINQSHRQRYHRDIVDGLPAFGEEEEYDEFLRPVDCSQLKALARQELIRRSLGA